MIIMVMMMIMIIVVIVMMMTAMMIVMTPMMMMMMLIAFRFALAYSSIMLSLLCISYQITGTDVRTILRSVSALFMR